MPKFYRYFSPNQHIKYIRNNTYFKEKRFHHRPVLLINKTTRLNPFHTEILDLWKKLYVPEFFEYFSQNQRIKIHKNNPYFKGKKFFCRPVLVKYVLHNAMNK